MTPATSGSRLPASTKAACAASVLDAFDRLEVMESTAAAIINARHRGEVSPMSDAVIEELKVVFLK
ncbi:MAG: hypothetical protein ABSH20_00615 [Tepidisphaeraceae bacterium]|jgi:L-fuculose-phosphate aldolase